MKTVELDGILGAPARLAIVATLARGQRLTFTALGAETGIADGNLHVQTRKLLAARYLDADRVRQGNRTVTRFELTERGRLGLLEYIRRLREAAEGSFQSTRTPEPDGVPGPDDRSRVW